jgi:hypothetical protein
MKTKFITAALGIAMAWMALPALSQDRLESASATPDYTPTMPIINVPPAGPSIEEVRATFRESVTLDELEEHNRKPEHTVNYVPAKVTYIPYQAPAYSWHNERPEEAVAMMPPESDDPPATLIEKELPPSNETPTGDGESTKNDTDSVVSEKPFSLEANYMSLPGKLRYDAYVSTGVWMTRGQAVAAVNDQINAATR